MSRDRADRARGALLGAFVGDALGMPFEGMPPASIPERVEMEDARRGRGTYTDDTQMTIALAESLVEHGSVDVERLGRAFVDACDLERGYGAGTLRALGLIRAGVPPLEAAARSFGGRGSLGNGAAMRVAPVAVAFAADPARVRAQAELSALVTHAHPVGIDAACVQAASFAAALGGDDPLAAAHAAARTAELRRGLDAVAALLAAAPRPSPAEVACALGNTSLGHESVPTALYAALAHASFEAALGFAVRCGGDTDTIAAMAGATAGARGGVTAIPARWLAGLEDGPKGRSHVERLALELTRSR